MCSPQKACQGRLCWGTEMATQKAAFHQVDKELGEWASPESLQRFATCLVTPWIPPPSCVCLHPSRAVLSIRLLPGARSPCCAQLHQPVLRSGELILLTHIWKHSFLCCGKSTQRHRIGTIKHVASWGSISSAWRVLHHAKLWLLQPHTSNLLHFSGPVVWSRSA